MRLFKPIPSIIAMIHVGALPGTPLASQALSAIVDQAVAEAQLYAEAGLDAIAIENMHDVPYLRGQVGPEIVAGMTLVAQAIKQAVDIPCGIQILAGANQAALAVAHTAGLDFIRAEGFVFAHVADEGTINACAGELLRYRRNIGATDVQIFTDIKKKHSSHAMTSDVDIVETAQAAEFFLSDGVIVTGLATGQKADPQELARVKQAVDIPVLVGSGVTATNLAQYWPHADGLIVGSYFKKQGHWSQAVEAERVHRFMDSVAQHRAQPQL